MGNRDYNNKTEESPYKNEQNARMNYEYLVNHSNNLRTKVSMKVHNGYNEQVMDPNGVRQIIWRVTEPIYVVFSWKGKNDENCALPLSFHIEPYEFQEKIKPFLLK